MEEGVEGEVRVAQEEAGGGEDGLDGEERRGRGTDGRRGPRE
jgi:hypothetical protein